MRFLCLSLSSVDSQRGEKKKLFFFSKFTKHFYKIHPKRRRDLPLPPFPTQQNPPMEHTMGNFNADTQPTPDWFAYFKERMAAFHGEMRGLLLRLPADHVLLQMAKEEESAKHISELVGDRVYEALRSNQERSIQDLLAKVSTLQRSCEDAEGAARRHEARALQLAETLKATTAQSSALQQELSAAKEKCANLTRHIEQQDTTLHQFDAMKEQLNQFSISILNNSSRSDKTTQQRLLGGVRDILHHFDSGGDTKQISRMLLESSQEVPRERERRDDEGKGRLKEVRALLGYYTTQQEIALDVFSKFVQSTQTAATPPTRPTLQALFSLVTSSINNACDHIADLHLAANSAQTTATLPQGLRNVGVLHSEVLRCLPTLQSQLLDTHKNLKQKISEMRAEVRQGASERTLLADDNERLKTEEKERKREESRREEYSRLVDAVTSKVDETKHLLRDTMLESSGMVQQSRLPHNATYPHEAPQQQTRNLTHSYEVAPNADHFISKADHMEKMHDLENSIIAETKTYIETKEAAVMKEAAHRVERAEENLLALQRREEKAKDAHQTLIVKNIEFKNELQFVQKSLEDEREKVMVAENAVGVLKGEVAKLSKRENNQENSGFFPHAVHLQQPTTETISLSQHSAMLKHEAELRKKQRRFDRKTVHAFKGLAMAAVAEMTACFAGDSVDHLSETLVQVQKANGEKEGNTHDNFDLHDAWVALKAFKESFDGKGFAFQQSRALLGDDMFEAGEAFDVASRIGNDAGDDDEEDEDTVVPAGASPTVLQAAFQQQKATLSTRHEMQLKTHKRFLLASLKEVSKNKALSAGLTDIFSRITTNLTGVIQTKQNKLQVVGQHCFKLRHTVTQLRHLRGSIADEVAAFSGVALRDVTTHTNEVLAAAGEMLTGRDSEAAQIAAQNRALNATLSDASVRVKELLTDVSLSLNKPFPQELFDGMFPNPSAQSSPSVSPMSQPRFKKTSLRGGLSSAFRQSLRSYVEEEVRPVVHDATSFVSLQPEFASLKQTIAEKENELRELKEMVTERDAHVSTLEEQLHGVEEERDTMLGHVEEHKQVSLCREQTESEREKLKVENSKLRRQQAALQVKTVANHIRTQETVEDSQRSLISEIETLRKSNHCVAAELSRLKSTHEEVLGTLEAEREGHHSKQSSLQLQYKATIERLHSESRLSEQLMQDVSDRDKELARVGLQLSHLSVSGENEAALRNG